MKQRPCTNDNNGFPNIPQNNIIIIIIIMCVDLLRFTGSRTESRS